MDKKEQLVTEKLNVLASMEETLALWRAEKQRAIDKAIPQEVKDKLAKIDVEFDDQIHVAGINIVSITADIKATVLALGHTVKGEKKQAVWVHGRRSWNSDGLQKYAKTHEEVWRFYNEGEPSVSIKEVKQ